MSCSSAGLWVGGMCASVRAMCVHVHVMHMGTARAACGTCISPPSMEILSLYNLFISQTHSVECAQWLVSWRGALQPGLRARENGCLLEKPRKNPRYLAVVLKVLPRVRYRLTTMNQLVDPMATSLIHGAEGNSCLGWHPQGVVSKYQMQRFVA